PADARLPSAPGATPSLPCAALGTSPVDQSSVSLRSTFTLHAWPARRWNRVTTGRFHYHAEAPVPLAVLPLLGGNRCLCRVGVLQGLGARPRLGGPWSRLAVSPRWRANGGSRDRLFRLVGPLFRQTRL